MVYYKNFSLMKLFCFPYAGGNRYSFNPFKALTPMGMELIMLDYPGHGMRMQEPLLTDIHSIAQDILQLYSTEMKSPFAFYGHSMGCLVAYTVCKILQSNKADLPQHLFFTGCGAPSVRNRFKGRHLQPYDEFIITLKQLGGVPDELLQDKDSMNFFEPLLRADFEAVDTYSYVPSEPFPIPMTIITGSEEDLSNQEIDAWRLETNQGCTFAKMSGGHFFIQQHYEALLRAIGNTLHASRQNMVG
jgi:surfactin synthase thioesterase subunit